MIDLPAFGPDCSAFFDFDGTLASIARRPQDVRVRPEVVAALARLQVRCGGAVAVLSGRPVAEIDHHLRPLSLPVAGVHGAERRSVHGAWHCAAAPDLSAAVASLQAFVDDHPGLQLERKAVALALHYRNAPDLAAACRAAMQTAQRSLPGMALLEGKKVLELKPAGADKGRALNAFMAEPPFAGRRPWFFGDDVTDEAGFAAVQALGGVAVKIGDGETVATWRLPDPAAMLAWLDTAAPEQEYP
jgi:trehalose 6-phosphate phosphatase